MNDRNEITVESHAQESTNQNGINVFLDRLHPFTDGESGKNKDTAIMLVKEGTARIEIDFKPYTLKPCQMLMLPPDSLFHCIEQSEDFRVACVTFNKDITADLTSRFEPSYFGFMTEYPIGDIPEADVIHIERMIEGIAHVLQKDGMEHSTLIARLLLQCYYLSQYDHCKQQITARSTQAISNQEQLFRRYISLIHEYAAYERNLSFYADKLCISIRYLSSIVRNQTGKTAKEFIDNHCIQEIKIRLRTTSEPLQSIAYSLKFPDQSFFSRYFKKNTGMTPKEFRAN